MASYLESSIVDNSISWTQIDRSTGGTVLIDNGELSSNYVFTSGTGGMGKVNFIWHATGRIAGSPTNIDLTSLTRNIFGSNVTLSLSGGYLKALMIKNPNTGITNILTLTITEGVSDFNSPFSSTSASIRIQPESSFSLSNKFGYAVNSTSRLFAIAGTGLEYEIAVLGSV